MFGDLRKLYLMMDISFSLPFVDDFSQHTCIHMLTHKGYVFTLIKSFVTYVQTQYQKTMKIIRTYNALELDYSNEGVKIFQEKRIQHKKSTAYTP